MKKIILFFLGFCFIAGAVYLVCQEIKEFKKLKEIAPVSQPEKNPILAEENQILASARAYVQKNNVPDLEFDLKIIKKLDKWALVNVQPLAGKTDENGVILEKVDGQWVARAMGTIFPEWEKRVPELFEAKPPASDVPAEPETPENKCDLTCASADYLLDKKRCRCLYQGRSDDYSYAQMVNQTDLQIYIWPCPREYSLSQGHLGYSELLEGVNKTEWLPSGVLKVAAIIYINCVLGIQDGSYELKDNNLTLFYQTTALPEGEQLVACACPHEAVYLIYNLEKKDYKIQISR